MITHIDDNSSIHGLEDFLQSIVDTVRNPLLVLDRGLCVVSASRAFYQTFGLTPETTLGKRVYDLGNRQWNILELRHLLEDVLQHDSEFSEYEVRQAFPNIGMRVMLLNGRKLYRPGNHTEMLLLSIEDVTDRFTKQEILQNAYERERRIAQALQRPLMHPVGENAFPGLSIATFYEPARRNEADVGGDFFDAFALPGGKIALVIADASGKGLEAAARTMQVKDVLRAFTLEYPHIPAHIIARLNDYVNESHFEEEHNEKFVCLALVIIDPVSGAGAAVMAGTEPLVLIRARGGEPEVLELPCIPLGVASRLDYLALPLQLAPGDTLIMLTDGITDARQKNEFFGMEGIVRIANEHRGKDVKTLGQIILDSATEFANGKLQDDACLLIARRTSVSRAP